MRGCGFYKYIRSVFSFKGLQSFSHLITGDARSARGGLYVITSVLAFSLLLISPTASAAYYTYYNAAVTQTHVLENGNVAVTIGVTGTYRGTTGFHTGAAGFVDYAITGSAVGGTDYTKSPNVAATGTSFAVPGELTIVVPIDNSVKDGDRTINLHISVPSTGLGGGYRAISTADATLTIVDDETQQVGITAVDTAASETGPDTGTYTISSEKPLAASTTVNLTASGTATLENDYHLSVASSTGALTQTSDGDFNAGDTTNNVAVSNGSVGLSAASVAYDAPTDATIGAQESYTPGYTGYGTSRPFLIAKPSGGYRLYYSTKDVHGIYWIAYRDTTDSNVPSMSNLGPEHLITTALGTQVSAPFVADLGGGQYRLYYSTVVTCCTYYSIAYQDTTTTDSSLPDETNLSTTATALWSSGNNTSGTLIQLASGYYRLYFNVSGSGLSYVDTTDFTPPNASNIGSIVTVLSGTTGGGAVVPLTAGNYRLYYSTGSQLAYQDTTDTNPPDSGNLGAQVLMNISSSNAPVQAFKLPGGNYRLNYQLSNIVYYRDDQGVPTYNTSGSFISSVEDFNVSVALTTLNYTATTPTGTSATMKVRAGDVATPDGTWTSWLDVTSSTDISSLGSHRYVQYQADLATTDTSVTPSLNDITVAYNVSATPTVVTTATGASSVTQTTDADFNGGTTGTSTRVAVDGVQLANSATSFSGLTGTEAGLVDLYHMENNFLDSGPKARDGSIGSGGYVSYISDAKLGSYSLYFNGSSLASAGIYQGVPELATANQPYSMEGWLKTVPGATTGDLIAEHSGVSWMYPLRLYGGKLRSSSWSSGGAVTVTGVTTVNDGHWHHFAVSWDPSGGLRLYVDGVLDTSAPQADYSPVVVSPWVQLDTTYIQSQWDELAFYDRALSPSEISAHANIGYASSGTYTSWVIDLGQSFGATTLDYTTTLPTNTALSVDVRGGDTALPDGTWTAWQTNIANGGDISALGTHRYVQYRVNLSTTDSKETPRLEDITFNYTGYPSPNQAQVVLPAGSTSTTLTLTPVDDTIQEYSEDATLTVASGTGYEPDSLSSFTGTVTIADNDFPQVNISANTDGFEQGGTPGTFIIRRTGILDAPLTVNYSVTGGTATLGADYTALSGTVTIPASTGIGTNGALVSFTPINDGIVEGTETIILSLSPDAAYVLGPSMTATENIIDNDTDGSYRADTSGIFLQSDWSVTAPTDGLSCTLYGGTWSGSACDSTHRDNQNGWSIFATAGSGLNTGTAGQVTEVSTPQQWLQTDDGTSDRGFRASGFDTSGFATVDGFADAADVTLAPIDVGDGSDGAFDSSNYNAGQNIPGLSGASPKFYINTDEATHQGVYNFTDFKIASGDTVTVTGSHPLKIYVQLNTQIDGTLIVLAAGGAGGNSSNEGQGVGPAGVGGGGIPDPNSACNNCSGGGGGGHAVAGADGTSSDSVTYPPGLGGAAYGDDPTVTTLYGGSGGGGNYYWGTCITGTHGGAGGGAVLIQTGDAISVAGIVNVNGGAGTSAGTASAAGSCSYRGHGASGGGAGGTIKLVATNITLLDGGTRLTAAGGAGGAGGGGAGGGGRIRLETDNLSGVANATSGTGTLSTAALNTGLISAGSGSYFSHVQYMGNVNGSIASPGVWSTMSWTEDVPAGSTLAVSVHSCAVSDCSDRGPTDWSPVVNGQDISALTFVNDADPFIQYKVDMSTTGGSVPRLHDVTINTISYGAAVWFQTDDSTGDTGFNKSGFASTNTLVAGNGDNASIVLGGLDAGTGADGDFDSGTYDGSSIAGITGVSPNITIDTDEVGHAGVYNFASFIVRKFDTVRVKGTNPFVLKSLGNVTANGTLSAAGYSGDTGYNGLPGPGGSAGGAGCSNGNGLGAGVAAVSGSASGGGGGGHATVGSVGEMRFDVAGGDGGLSYGDPALPTLEGGSGGGGSAVPSGTCANGAYGGGGGGEMEIIAGDSVIVGTLGVISVDGGAGGGSAYLASYDSGGGGGGSAGSLDIDADKVVLNNPGASLSARGGAGGDSYFLGDGGAGGDGRIDVVANSIQGSTNINIGGGSLITPTPTPLGSPVIGSYVSAIYDAGYPVTWDPMYWVSSVPTGTSLTMSLHSCAVADCSDRGPSDWSVVTNGQDISSLAFVNDGDRYIQYRVEMSSDGHSVPRLDSIAINLKQNMDGSAVVSSVYDTQDIHNQIVALEWTADTSSPGTAVKFQLRTSADGTTWTDWLGPTSNTDYYTVSGSTINPVHADGTGDRYVQYKAILVNTNPEFTPILQDVTLKYITYGSGAVVNSSTAFGGSSGGGGGGALGIPFIAMILMSVGIRLRRYWAVLCNGVVLLVLAGTATSAYAEFVLNFSGANPPNPDQTQFKSYSVGNINSDFYQEFIIQKGFGYYQGDTATASIGSGSGGGGSPDTLGFGGGDYTVTGNGTGNPNRVIVWQRNKSSDMLLDFLKGQFDKKPRIMQTLVTNDVLAEFSVDMSGLTYSDNSTAAPIVNTLTIPGQQTTYPALSAKWDMAVDAQNTDITAGMFTYTTGSSRGGSAGAYNYVGGNYPVYTIDWWHYFDKTDASNVWTNSTNKPK